jgi:hypothetical protein
MLKNTRKNIKESSNYKPIQKFFTFFALNMFKREILVFALLLSSITSLAQETRYRYLVLFKDKNNSSFSINKPEQFLSSSAISRRIRNKVSISEQDLPVNQNYLQEIKASGALIVYPLKWINGVLIKEKPSNIAKIKALKSVAGLYKNMPLDSSSDLRLQVQTNQISDESNSLDYGISLPQITQLGVDQMHTKGFSGKDARLLRLVSINNSISATSGIFFSGQTFDESIDGMPVGKQVVETVDFTNGVFSFILYPRSSAILEYM